MTPTTESRRPGLPRRVPAALVVAMLLIPAAAAAQDVTDRSSTTFTPTLFVMGSFTNNELRSAVDPISASSIYSEAELPFVFRGKRWSGGFSVNPAWRKYSELDQLNQFETSLSGWLDGRLGQRTRLRVLMGGAHTSQLTALDVADIITPRTKRNRARGSASLQHLLNPRGDTLDLAAEYDSTGYPDGEFVGQRSFGLLGGYSRALDTRLSVSVSGRVDRIQYDDGGWVNTGTPLLGFGYRAGPRTDLSLRGGLSFSQRGGSAGTSTSDGARQTVAFLGELRHRGENWAMTLSAGRRIASGVAIGEPTIRTQLLGILGWQDARWRLGITAGIASNKLLEDQGNAILLTPEGLVATSASEIRTFTTCIGVGYRALQWASLVGAGRFGVQEPVGAPDALGLDIYRFSIGVALHPQAPAINSAAGADVLGRYGRAGSIGSC
jgi:hypothetical protein